MRYRKYIHKLVLLLIITIFGVKSGMCQYSEYEIKAAYLFNFAKFIEWPSPQSNSDTITLGIYKNDPFGIVLEKTMIGRKVNGKVWKIVRTSKLQDLDNCQMVFFSDVEKYDLLKLITHLKNKPILTIGDEIMDFCKIGGAINFTPQFSEFQFEINNEVAKGNRVVISPKLLVLAKIISISENEF